MVLFSHKPRLGCFRDSVGKAVGNCNRLHESWNTIPTRVGECFLRVTRHHAPDFVSTVQCKNLTIIVDLNLSEIAVDPAPRHCVALVGATKLARATVVPPEVPETSDAPALSFASTGSTTEQHPPRSVIAPSAAPTLPEALQDVVVNTKFAEAAIRHLETAIPDNTVAEALADTLAMNAHPSVQVSVSGPTSWFASQSCGSLEEEDTMIVGCQVSHMES